MRIYSDSFYYFKISNVSFCRMMLLGRPSSNLLSLKILLMLNCAIGLYRSRTSTNLCISRSSPVPSGLFLHSSRITFVKASLIVMFSSTSSSLKSLSLSCTTSPGLSTLFSLICNLATLSLNERLESFELILPFPKFSPDAPGVRILREGIS